MSGGPQKRQELTLRQKVQLIQHSDVNYQRGSLCQDPAGSRTTRRPPERPRKETQTEVVRTCLPFIRSGQNHLARHSERGKKTRQTEEEVGKQRQEIDRPGVHQLPEGSGEQKKGGNWLWSDLLCPNDPLWWRDRWKMRESWEVWSYGWPTQQHPVRWPPRHVNPPFAQSNSWLCKWVLTVSQTTVTSSRFDKFDFSMK